MKSISKFIPFWWKHMGSDAQMTLELILLTLCITVSAVLGGFVGVVYMVVLCGLLAILVVVTMVIVYLCRANISAWRAYKDMIDKDEQKIVNRLKGDC
jgi:ABC-type phosphate/phosphonate transport system permease subunit